MLLSLAILKAKPNTHLGFSSATCSFLFHIDSRKDQIAKVAFFQQNYNCRWHVVVYVSDCYMRNLPAAILDIRPELVTPSLCVENALSCRKKTTDRPFERHAPLQLWRAVGGHLRQAAAHVWAVEGRRSMHESTSWAWPAFSISMQHGNGRLKRACRAMERPLRAHNEKWKISLL